MVLGEVRFCASNPSTFAPGNRTLEQVDMIVLHTMEGTFDGTHQWFQSGAKAASHYCIARDGRIIQYVANKDIAYHAANWDYNCRSIGIELEAALDPNSKKMFGFPPNDFPTVMLGQLVLLTRAVIEAYPKIVPDRTHIIGHNEVPNPKDPSKFGGLGGHEDPGHLFPWDNFMASIQ
jgi:N-acetyl-anhydromuramyl-L-alanine amidase AmpD